MSSDAIRETIATKLVATFPLAAPTVKLFFENQDFAQPTNQTAWAYCTIQDSRTGRCEISNAGRYETLGVVNIQIMTPEGTGTKLIRTVCDKLSLILTDKQFPLIGETGSVTFYGYQKRNRGSLNGWYTWNAIWEYKAFSTTP